MGTRVIGLALAASYVATVGADCDVSGFAVPTGGVVRNTLCVNDWGDMAVGSDSCVVDANPGYVCTGTQASCTGGLGGFLGTFNAGSVTCTAFTCTTPNTAGYIVQVETSLLARSFSVSGICANHYSGTFTAAACTSAGAYTLSGCLPIVCTRPSNTVGYSPTDVQLNTAVGFVVTGSCATGFFGTFAITACTSNGPYLLSGCNPCSPQVGCANSRSHGTRARALALLMPCPDKNANEIVSPNWFIRSLPILHRTLFVV